MPHGMETQRDSQSTRAAAADTEFAGKNVHLIGMGGSGMQALAAVLIDRGAHVSGSDLAASAATDRLGRAGATVHIGQRGENVAAETDLVVYSAAIHEQNPELLAARQRGVELLKYSEMLGRLMAGRVGLAIAGTHGKSTTSAMVSYALSEAGADPTFVVGATVTQLGGPSGAGAGPHFVTEACEFDRSFLNLHPRYAALLNIEEDHLDCYEDLSAIIEAFRAFAGCVDEAGAIVANGEDRHVMQAVRQARTHVEPFGLTPQCAWRGLNVTAEAGVYERDVEYGGKPFCHLRAPLPGLHNAYNALAAVGLLHHAGLAAETIPDALSRFTGAHRRMTVKGSGRGITVMDDYAHHPTELQATLHTLRQHYHPRRLICVFQPHQHSRTRFLLKDFARSFGACDEVIVPDIYFVRDSEREKDYISSEDLVAQIRLHGARATYLPTFEQIAAHLREDLAAGDLVVTMGAGNIWEVADEIVRWLG